jgi:hypothetical protein
MPKFRKKPIVIEAVKVTPENWNNISDNIWQGSSGKYYIATLEGDMVFEIGDWIITGIEGEQYSCKDSIFQETYDPV